MRLTKAQATRIQRVANQDMPGFDHDGNPVPAHADQLDPYALRQEAARIIGEDRVPVDILRELIEDYGN